MAYISKHTGEEIESAVQNIKNDIYVNESGDTMTGQLITPSIRLVNEYPYINFMDKNGIKRGEIYNSEKGIFNIRQMSTDNSGYYDSYYLPNPGNLTQNTEYPILTKKNILDMMYPIGSCYTTSTNTNPSSFLGGTWNLIDKGLSYLSDTPSFTLNTTNCTEATVYFMRAGHTIRLRISVTNKAAVNDTTTEFLTLDLSSIGITSLNYQGYPVGRSDGGECIIEGSITSDGVFSVQDVVPAADGKTWAKETAAQFEWVTVVPISSMIDSACNYFLWKRIS